MALVDKLQFNVSGRETREEKQARLKYEDDQRRKNALEDYREERKIKYEYDLQLLEKSFELQKESDKIKHERELELLERRYELEKELIKLKNN